MRQNLNGSGGALRCDVPGCAHGAFVTYSMVSLTRAQAEAIGWRRMSGRKLSGGEPGLILSLKMVDVCTTCDPPPYEKIPKPPKGPRKRTRKPKQVEVTP